jgi:hypothetical protein
MNLRDVKIDTLKDLRDFLNEQPEDILDNSVEVWIGDNESTSTISLVEVLTEDHFNPSGDYLEPVSAYRRGGEHFEGPNHMSEEEIAEERIIRKGKFFFVIH